MWDENTYPKSWKEAIIIPIPKPNKNRLVPSSLRPISLTCCMGKLFERMINNRLQNYLENKNLLVSYQAGYRKKRSTVDHLTLLEHHIQEAFRKREHLIAVFFDIKGAFDMTWRYAILNKLSHFGLKGKLPLLIKSFLEDRHFRVRVGDHLSDVRVLENGVPQGSTLSCTLFAVAINEICKGVNQNIKKCLYVDDVAIFYSAKKVGDITSTLQPAINTIIQNGEKVGFQFSKEKTKCVHFCRLRKPHYDPLLYLKENVIECVDSFKFLGLIFDCKLTWKKHIELINTKCRQSLNILKVLAHTKWGADPQSLLMIYKTLILSKIDYGSIAYSSARKSLLDILNKIQNLGIRYCLGAFPTTPIQSLHCESAIIPLEIRRKILMTTYLTGAKANHKNPNNEFLFPEENMYYNRISNTRPLAVRYIEYLREIDLDFPEIRAGNQNDEETVNNDAASRNEAANTIKSRIINQWQNVWDRTNTLLHRLEPTIKQKYESMKLSRLDAVKAFRLRSGHTSLTHQHLLKGEPPPTCVQCNVTLSVDHIISECPLYNPQRQLYDLRPHIEENLKNKSIKNTLEFMKCIGMFNKI